MRDINEAISAADRLAAQAWRWASGPGAFGWRDAFGVGVMPLAQFVAANPAATAEKLYAFAISLDAAPRLKPPASWRELPAALRVAIEIFRATFLAFYAELEARPQAGRLRVVPTRPVSDGARAGCQRPASEGATVTPIASPELKRSPLVTGNVKSPTPADSIDPLAELLDRRIVEDNGRPAKKGGR